MKLIPTVITFNYSDVLLKTMDVSNLFDTSILKLRLIFVITEC